MEMMDGSHFDFFFNSTGAFLLADGLKKNPRIISL